MVTLCIKLIANGGVEMVSDPILPYYLHAGYPLIACMLKKVTIRKRPGPPVSDNPRLQPLWWHLVVGRFTAEFGRFTVYTVQFETL